MVGRDPQRRPTLLWNLGLRLISIDQRRHPTQSSHRAPKRDVTTGTLDSLKMRQRTDMTAAAGMTRAVGSLTMPCVDASVERLMGWLSTSWRVLGEEGGVSGGGVTPKNHVHTSSELLYLRPSLILLCCRHFYFDTVFCNSDSSPC